MVKNYSFRVPAAIITIIICTMFVIVRMLVEVIVFPELLTKDIAQYEKRFEKLREALPKRGIVGYISDEQKDENEGRYCVTQYALTPVIVNKSVEHRTIVGNFHNSPLNPELYDKYGLIVTKDFENGVIIFKRVIK